MFVFTTEYFSFQILSINYEGKNHTPKWLGDLKDCADCPSIVISVISGSFSKHAYMHIGIIIRTSKSHY